MLKQGHSDAVPLIQLETPWIQYPGGLPVALAVMADIRIQRRLRENLRGMAHGQTTDAEKVRLRLRVAATRFF